MSSGEALIITLDGPAGSGKSTASYQLAYRLGLPCLDTGAMYRMVGKRALDLGLNMDDEDLIAKEAERLRFRFAFKGAKPIVEASIDGGNFIMLGPEIRTPEVSMAASRIARLKRVRQVLVRQQQEIGRVNGAVVEGRDAGTVIFPKARIKFFLTASIEERARRRYEELKQTSAKTNLDYSQVLDDVKRRDAQDEGREFSPTKAAVDAEIIDTTGLNLDQVLEILESKVRNKSANTPK